MDKNHVSLFIKVTPRCHLNCKSKVLLESICNSCHAMKECLRNEHDFNKYFEDEEFETSHWPCERCLEALKSIKMLWKIIVEKVFHINTPKSYQINHSSADDVRSVAKAWQADLAQQTTFVKNRKPLLPHNDLIWRAKNYTQEDVTPCNLKSEGRNSSDLISNSYKSSRMNTTKFCKSTDTQSLSYCYRNNRRRRISRQTSTKFPTVETASSCTDLNDEVTTHKVNLNCLREKLKDKNKEIEKLKQENGGLKAQLQTLYKSLWCESYFYTPNVAGSNDLIEKIPKPFEGCDCEENVNTNATKNIDSEMIITMKNCKNESYRHISLLQVLHKTNAPDSDLAFYENRCKKEDPLALLEKVQHTFGAIVSREISRASHRSYCEDNFDIDASYHKLNGSKSEPSCSTTTLKSCNSYCDTCRLIREE